MKTFLVILVSVLVFALLPEYPFFTRNLNKAGEYNCLLFYLIRKLRK